MGRSRSQRSFRHIPRFEILEDRSLPSGLNPLMDVADTLTHAWDLGNGSALGAAQVREDIGNSAAAADVDWYTFRLDQPSSVTLRVQPGESGDFAGLVALWSNDPDSLDPAVAQLGHRLIGRGEGALTASLAAGAYFVAVSGAGNAWFNPFVADSGALGATGSYSLGVESTPLDLSVLTVLGSNVPADGVFPEAPLSLHVRLSDAIDLSTSDVQIFQWADGVPIDFVQLQLVHYSPDSHELQLVFNKGLNPGFYTVMAFGGEFFDLLFGPVPFEVASIEGGGEANDAAATATDLGVLSHGDVLDRAGYIGNNPAYENLGDPTLPGPGADLDVYRFTVRGDGQHALIAEVSANRIGSPLDPGLTLFRIEDGHAVLIAGNNHTGNLTRGDDGSIPLYTDSALFAALTAGDYFLIVSAAENTLDPILGQGFGSESYDPVAGDAPRVGSTTGAYVVHLFLTPSDQKAPAVIETTLKPGAVLDESPTTFTVQFSEFVSLQQLAYQADQQHLSVSTHAVFFENQTGERYFAHLVSYDAATSTAQFVMRDRLSDGSWELHLSGAAGLSDLGGNPLGGNTGDGDFVVSFTVNADGPAEPMRRRVADPRDSINSPQDLGVLFTHELAQGVAISRQSGQSVGDADDVYRFTVAEPMELVFTLGGQGLNVPGRPVLLGSLAAEVTTNPDPSAPGNRSLRVFLSVGTHFIKVEWDARSVAKPVYQLTISSGSMPENPTPLTQGPAPAFRLNLATRLPAAPAAVNTVRLPTPSAVVTVALDRSTSSAAPPAIANPSGALVALAAAPVGGARSGDLPSTSNNVVVQLNLPTFEFVSQAGALSPSEDAKADQAETRPDPGLNQFLRGIVERLFDTLQQLLKPVASAVPESEVEPPEFDDPSGANPELQAVDAALSLEATPVVAGETTNQAWGGVLLALGALALRGDARKKSRTGSPKRSLPIA